MVSFEIFVKAMPPSLSELKVLPSFCLAFKIPDDVAASSKYCDKWAIIVIRMIYNYLYLKMVYQINVKICFCLKWESHNQSYCYKILGQALVITMLSMYWFFVLHYWVSRIEIISFSSNSVFPSIHARFIYRSECNTIFFVK